SKGDERAQLHQLRFASDRRSLRRPYGAVYRGQYLDGEVRTRGDDVQDRRRPDVLLPAARPVRRGGRGADRERLRQGCPSAVADGICRRGAEADRGQPGRLGGMTVKRVWHGWTTPGNVDAYENLLKTYV